MKNSKATIVKLFSLLSLIFIFGCSSDNIESKQNLIVQNQSSNVEDEFALLLERYDVEALYVNEAEGLYELIYPNDDTLNIEKVSEDRYILKGSRLNNNIVGFYIEEGHGEPSEKIVFTDENFKNRLTIQEFGSIVNESLVQRSPCGNHPSNESFDDCVVREIDEFCDGFWGCAALVTHGPAIVVLIGIHCASCEAAVE